MSEKKVTSYRDAGVDIDAGNALVERIKPAVKSTLRPEVIGGIGGFGGLFQVDLSRFGEPVMVAGADGVGTKLKLALQTGIHSGVGIDLVAMCVNDVLVQGAEPQFFLDYYACGKLDNDVAATVIEGIAEGCRQAGCALLGGETAEMPGMYDGEDYDLAGFCVGMVNRSDLIDGSGTAAGDIVIGLSSSGPHSNGYSLIRRLIDDSGTDLNTPWEGRTLGEALLEPTRIYVKPVLAVLKEVPVKAISHITGGGILENLNRVLPADLDARVELDSWSTPAIFGWLQEQSGLDDTEMLRTFNGGIGMTLTVAPDDAQRTLDLLSAAGETAQIIGEIVPGSGEVQLA